MARHFHYPSFRQLKEKMIGCHDPYGVDRRPARMEQRAQFFLIPYGDRRLMNHHVLVIDKDPKLVEEVRDCLDSLQSTYDCASNQDSARRYLRSHVYSYVILEMEIPVKYGHPARVRNGLTLLSEIREHHNRDDLPVIAMSAQGLNSPDLAVEALCDGDANDFVKKPFPLRGETLEKRILAALNRARRSRTTRGAASEGKQADTPPEPFESGEMVFFEHRVELCGIRICGDHSGMIRRILDKLRQRSAKGTYKGFSGEELATDLGCDTGQNGIASAIREFRNRTARLFLDEGVQLNKEIDIILNDRQHGYRLSDKITVETMDYSCNDPVIKSHDLDHDPQNRSHESHHYPQNERIEPLGERQQWIMKELESGNPLRIQDIKRQFNCSNATAKRELSQLRNRGLIIFEGPSRVGFWKLAH